MKVRELIALLSTAEPDSEVILQRDSEGNGYSPLYSVDCGSVYVPETTYSGEVYSPDWSADEADATEKEWRAIKAMPRCVVLAPTN
jgi:hypothetical protein